MDRPVAARRPVRVDPLLAVLALVGVCGTAALGFGGADRAVLVVAFWVLLGVVQVIFLVVARGLARSVPAGAAEAHATVRLWRCFTVAAAALVTGDVVQLVLVPRDPLSPGSTLGTVPQMALLGIGILMLLYGLLRWPPGVSGAGSRARLRLDVATVMAGATTCGLWLFEVPAGDGGWLWMVQVVIALLLEPGLFLVAIFVVVRISLSGRSPFTPRAGIVLGLATVVQAVVQAVPASAYMTDVHGPWLLGGNVVGSTLLAAGVRLHAVGTPAGARPAGGTRRPYSVLPYGAMAATWALALGVVLADGLSRRSWVVVIGAMITTALVVGRQVAAFRHIAELLRERDELAARLTELAYHDGLTGLPNRALFMKRLTEHLATGPVTVFLIDLNHFKPVNDTYGHAAGDRLLVEVAARLRAAVRAGDTVARLGGDEFAVLIADSAGDRLPALAAALRGSARLGEHVVPVSASIGMAHGSGGADRLLHEADMAMYAAKRATVGV